MDYKCSICGETFDNIADLIDHLSGHQEEENQKIDMQADLDEINEMIKDLTEEIDKFNEVYSNLMKIDYTFTFTKKEDNSAETYNNCSTEAAPNGACKKNFVKEDEDEFIKTIDEFINELNIKDKLEKAKKKPEMSFIEFLDTIFE